MPKDTDPQEATLKSILRPAIAAIIDYLVTRTGGRSRADLAQVRGTEGVPSDAPPETMPDANALYRYVKGRVLPLKNLPKLCRSAGLNLGQTGWLLGYFLMEKNRDHPVDLDPQPGEAREPQGRDLESELEVIMELDFGILDPDDMFDHNRERNALQAACLADLAEVEETQERVNRKIASLLDLLDLFKERSEKAILRARGARSG